MFSLQTRFINKINLDCPNVTCNCLILSCDIFFSIPFVVLSHHHSFHCGLQACPPGADVIKQTELESQQLSLPADRQPLQTRHSISFAGSWSHNKQCSLAHRTYTTLTLTLTLTHTHTHTRTHTHAHTHTKQVHFS